MIPARYNAPNARRVFSERSKLKRWTEWTKAFARSAVAADNLTEEGAQERIQAIDEITPPPPGMVEAAEGITGHDLVAFLSVIEKRVPNEVKPYLHYGLTSSDIVDNAHFEALRNHANDLALCVEDLTNAVHKAGIEGANTVRAGRTHGQIADVTSWNHQLLVQLNVIRRIQFDLEGYYSRSIVKSAGPTGKSPLVLGRANVLAQNLVNGIVVRSTQVIPRDYQLEWACLYVRLAGAMENLALQVRLGARSEVGELAEGAAANRVGSSAMPHKRNPIDSEKVCGMARTARGLFSAIAEGVALWEDRDLTNSSMERIAVPGLATNVEHMVLVMTDVMRNLQVNYERMQANATDPHTMSNLLQTLAQKHFRIGPVHAGQIIRNLVQFREEGPPVVDGFELIKALQTDKETVEAWVTEALSIMDEILG